MNPSDSTYLCAIKWQVAGDLKLLDQKLVRHRVYTDILRPASSEYTLTISRVTQSVERPANKNNHIDRNVIMWQKVIMWQVHFLRSQFWNHKSSALAHTLECGQYLKKHKQQDRHLRTHTCQQLISLQLFYRCLCECSQGRICLPQNPFVWQSARSRM